MTTQPAGTKAYTTPPDTAGLLRDALSNLNDLADQKNADIDLMKKAMRAALDALTRLSTAYHWKPFVTEDENDPWKPVEQYGLDAITQLRAALLGEQG